MSEKKFQTGHDFAAQAHIKGADVKTWDKGSNNFYKASIKTGESVIFPVGRLSSGTRANLFVVFLKLGLSLIFIGLPILFVIAELASKGVIK